MEVCPTSDDPALRTTCELRVSLVGLVNLVPLGQSMGNSGTATSVDSQRSIGRHVRYDLIVIAFAAIIYLISCFSPPSLMDDVDAVQAQIARNMLQSGDWVTARLDG